ncbi:MAG: serine protease [Thermoanaerobaculia bacterium]|nr:serine protease [Thermoanaerobaculia bacterium]
MAHFAAPRQVDVDPWSFGVWRAQKSESSTTRATARWTLGIVADGATSISLRFDRFQLPDGAELVLRGATAASRPLTLADAVPNRRGDAPELWTPPILGSRVDLELKVPIDRLGQIDLHLDRIHHGYAGFASPESTASGCRLDVGCDDARPGEESEALRQQATSVALLIIDGVRFCSGFLVSDVAQSGQPLLLTAAHCGLDHRAADSVVVLWNYRRKICGGTTPAPSASFQSGATLLASNRRTDVALLELNRRPDPKWNLTWAGWDRSDDPLGTAITVHHPNAGPQSFARATTAARSHYFATADDPAGDHLRIESWSEGTTEGGSSGAPLFDADGRVRGWLRGGHAACDNRLPDWFGRLADAWDDHRGPSYRLRDWLDPRGTEMVAVDGWSQSSVGPGQLQ